MITSNRGLTFNQSQGRVNTQSQRGLGFPIGVAPTKQLLPEQRLFNKLGKAGYSELTRHQQLINALQSGNSVPDNNDSKNNKIVNTDGGGDDPKKNVKLDDSNDAEKRKEEKDGFFRNLVGGLFGQKTDQSTNPGYNGPPISSTAGQAMDLRGNKEAVQQNNFIPDQQGQPELPFQSKQIFDIKQIDRGTDEDYDVNPPNGSKEMADKIGRGEYVLKDDPMQQVYDLAQHFSPNSDDDKQVRQKLETMFNSLSSIKQSWGKLDKNTFDEVREAMLESELYLERKHRKTLRGGQDTLQIKLDRARALQALEQAELSLQVKAVLAANELISNPRGNDGKEIYTEEERKKRNRDALSAFIVNGVFDVMGYLLKRTGQMYVDKLLLGGLPAIQSATFDLLGGGQPPAIEDLPSQPGGVRQGDLLEFEQMITRAMAQDRRQQAGARQVEYFELF